MSPKINPRIFFLGCTVTPNGDSIYVNKCLARSFLAGFFCCPIQYVSLLKQAPGLSGYPKHAPCVAGAHGFTLRRRLASVNSTLAGIHGNGNTHTGFAVYATAEGGRGVVDCGATGAGEHG